MRTVANMASRLDMSTEEAVNVLRKLRVDVDNAEVEITDDQCDMLMDVDEDPSAIDEFLAEIAKREEKDRKRKENLQKAAKKAVAKRKATVAKKKTTVKKKAPAKKKTTTKKKAAAKVEAGAVELDASAVEAPAEVDAEAAESPEAKPAAEAVAPVAAPRAEILPDVPAPDSGAKADIIDEDAPSAPPRVSKKVAGGEMGEEGALARAEREEEEAKRQQAQKPSRLLPTPDPAVVADVIRKAGERERVKQDRNTGPRPGGARPGGARPGGARPGGARPGERPAGGRGGREGAWRSGKLGNASIGVVTDEVKAELFRNAARRPGAPSGKTAKKRKKRAERARVQEDIMRREAGAAVRGVLAGGLDGGAVPRKKRKKRRGTGEAGMEVEMTAGGVIEVDETMTAEQLAAALGIEVNDLILGLMDENIMATKNQVLELSLIRKIAAHYEFEVRTVIPEEEELLKEEPDNPEDLKLRAPVVTVMGHVDHGKTSLLDMVRRASVADGEAGGITQHIAAYDVKLKSGRVVFLDTPGHEAFTQMRARGARITDIVVLVVAADDGVKPQTKEAIDHARAAGVPIVVAVNKCDKPDAQPERVRQELTKYDLLAEEWGGKTIIKDISAKTGDGVDELMEMLALQAEMLELKANPDKSARGAIVESEMSTGQGPVAWVLVQSGTLKVGDPFISGEAFGRVRTMTDSHGNSIKEAAPSTPVLVTGFNMVPVAGDPFICVVDERAARSVAEKRQTLNRQKRGAVTRHMTLEDFHARMLGGEQKMLNTIVKADVQGSADVLNSSLAKLGNEEVRVSVVHSGVGPISESDVMLASASDAVILGFHIGANARTRQVAEAEGVEIRTYLVIYELIDEVSNALEGMLTPDSLEIVTGHAEIREVFRSSALGNIAGCLQQDGETQRGSEARILRNGVVVHTGRIASVRREKDDVKSVSAGFECGIRFEKFSDIQSGDVIESYRIEQVAKTL